MKTLSFILSFLYTALTPWVVLAAGSGAHEVHGPGLDILFKAINLFLFLGLFYFLLKKPLVNYFDLRAKGIKDLVEQTKKMHEQASQENQEIKQRLENVEAQAADMLESFKKAGQAEAAKVVEQAEKHADKIRADAKEIAEAELARATEELRQKAVYLTEKIAREMIEREVKGQEFDRLTESSIGQIRKIH